MERVLGDIRIHIRSQLRGQTSEMLMGIKLANDKYNTAIALLNERCGKKQVMIT